MIRADQIPPEVGEAAMDAVKNGVHDPKAVVAAAINAWPATTTSTAADYCGPGIFLPFFPLPQEPTL